MLSNNAFIMSKIPLHFCRSSTLESGSILPLVAASSYNTAKHRPQPALSAETPIEMPRAGVPLAKFFNHLPKAHLPKLQVIMIRVTQNLSHIIATSVGISTKLNVYPKVATSPRSPRVPISTQRANKYSSLLNVS